jgi:hypothetical protein
MRGELHECFCGWQTPDVLFAKADEAGNAIGRERFLHGNATKHLREAWVIGRIGTLLGATRARLSRTDPPDGYLELSDIGVIPVEVTECLQEGRRRGDEDHSAMLVHHHQDELDAAIEYNKDWVEALIRKKLAKDARCPPNTVLLVYHNTSLFNFNPEKTRVELEAASQLRGTNIVGSMILYEGEVYGRGTLARIEHPAHQA